MALSRVRKRVFSGVARVSTVLVCLVAARGESVVRGQSAGCASMPAGLVACWAGEGNAEDAAGSNQGTVQGMVTYAPGVVGQAFSFGLQRSVIVADSPVLDLTTQFTLSAWINPAALMSDPTYGGIISKVGGAGGNNGYQFALVGQNRVLVIQFNAAGEPWPQNQLAVTLPEAIPVGVWTHVAATYDGQNLNLYVNGAAAGTRFVGSKTVANSSSQFRISGDDNNNVWFNGLMDEVAVFNRALAHSEITALADRPVTIDAPASFANAALHQSYSRALAAAGGEPPYTYSLAGGSLPPGLSLSASGVVSGVTTAAGTYSFAVAVSDRLGESSQRSYQMSVALPSSGPQLDVSSDGRLGASGQYFRYDWVQYFIHTDNGEIYEQYSNYPWELRASPPKRVISQAAGPDIVVFDFESFHLPQNFRLTIVGSRPAAIVSRTDLRVDGTLIVWAGGGAGGVGGYPGRSESTAGGPAPHGGHSGGSGGRYLVPSTRTPWGWEYQAAGGGGGGGHATTGDSGNPGNTIQNGTQFPGGTGGVGIPSDVFRGGGGGGAGGWGLAQFEYPGADGGRGGGALILAAAQDVTVGATGVVSADGEQGGYFQGVAGGGGAGAGGYLIVSGQAFRNDGRVTARGGHGSEIYPHVNAPYESAEASDGGHGSGGRVVIAAASVINNGALDVSGGDGTSDTGGNLSTAAVVDGAGVVEGIGSGGSLATTPTGGFVRVRPSADTLVTYEDVGGMGTTAIIAIDPASAGQPPPGMTLTAPAYDISTTASYSGDITVCFTVSWVNDAATFARLRILHGENGVLVDRTVMPPDPSGPSFDDRRLCARVASLSPFVFALVPAASVLPAHLWMADYNMEWIGPREAGDVIADGLYSFKYSWRFGILNDPFGTIDTSTIAVNTALGGLQPAQHAGVSLDPAYPPFVWSGPPLAPAGQPGTSSYFTQVTSNLPVPVSYALGYTATRSLSGGAIAAGASEVRSFTLTVVPNDAALTQIGGSVMFDQPVPGGPVMASNVSCSSTTGSIGPVPAGGTAVSWHVQEQATPGVLTPGSVHTLTCSVTLTNPGAAPAVFSPHVVVSGQRSAARVSSNGASVSFTSDAQTDPADPLGTVQFDVTGTGGPLVANFDRRFTRTSFFEPINRVLDVTPPTTSAATTPPAPNGTNGWFTTGQVTVALNANDAGGSGVREITYSLSGAQTYGQTTVAGPFASITITAPGSTTITFQGTDHAGNVESPKTITVRRDSLPPASSAVLSPSPNASGWNNGPVSATIVASDSGSGVAKICYTLSGATVQPETCAAGTSVTVPVTAYGTTFVGFAAIDEAGNREAPKPAMPVRIDNIAPVSAANVPPPNQFGWYTNDVTLFLSGGDGHAAGFSGVSAIEYAINGVQQTSILGLSGSVVIATEGSTTIQYRALDRAGNVETVKSLTIDIDKTPPSIAVAPSYSTHEGSVLQIPVQASGTPGESVTILGCGVISGAGSASYVNGVCTYSAPDGPADGVVGIAAGDGHGNVAQVATSVTVANVAPSIGDVTGPTAPIRTGTVATLHVSYADPGVLDTAVCTFDWNDGTAPTSAVGPQNVCSATHTYAAPGVYSVRVTVADDDGGASTTAFDYVVVFDPEAGSITGGGAIAVGADRANFGFNAKYQGERAAGQTQFQLKSAKLDFHGSSYDWLVVYSGMAVYEGAGAVNGASGYRFRVTAVDGQVSGTGADTFRIRIWKAATAEIVYDSEPGADDYAVPTRELAAGNVVAHK